MDTLYEIHRQLFDDIPYHNNMGYYFYKLQGGLNLKIGCQYGFTITKCVNKKGEKIDRALFCL